MVELYLIITGLIFFAWLYALVRQTQQGIGAEQAAPARPIVPVNLLESDEAVVVAEGRGRVVYANDPAREWFGMNGGAPSLSLMAQKVQPADTLHDLFADSGHASFRLGQRRIEAVSHAIPTQEGRRMVVVMREMTAAASQTYTEYDPLRALAILGDIAHAVGVGMELEATVDAILRSIAQSIVYDSGEVTVWHPETETLRPAGRITATTAPLSQPDDSQVAFKMGEGYSGWIAMYRQPLLIADTAARTDLTPRATQTRHQSFVGVPLLVSDRFVGTLELAHRQRNAFTQRDVTLLQTISGQAAAAIEAARLYRDQRARVEELNGLQQIAEAMSQLAEPAELYGQLTQRIAHLVGVDLCGVLLFDEDEQVFRSQPPFYGVLDSIVAQYRLPVQPDSELESIWRYQPWWYSNDPSSDVMREIGLGGLISAVRLNSLALLPMIVGARRIGLLIVANKHGGRGFSESDMRALMSYAAQAAVVVENARLYGEEQRRNRELGGLQQIAQAMGVLRTPTELYDQITSRIAALMNVQMCGVLLFDPKDRVLVSQRPFYGMDDVESVNFYQLPSPLGGPVARLWLEHDTWYSNDLRHDPLAGDTDLAQLGAAVGIRQTMIAALVVGGTRLGIIQASNKLDGTDFSEDDARILSIFAGQAAILIDNARLYREMQSRTHEAEGLRAITEMASVAEPSAETIEQVITSIANLLEADIVAIALIHENTGELVIEPGYVWGVDAEEPYRIDAYAPGFEHSVVVSRRPFASNNLRDDRRLLPQYRAMVERFDLRSAIQVPLLVQDRSIGELTVANKSTGEGFTPAELQLLGAIGTQVAVMLDRMRLAQATDEDLLARLEELDALSRVSHELSRTIDLERILDVIRHEALRSTEATAASILLLAEPEDWPAPDRPLIDRRYGEESDLSTLAPIESAAIQRGRTVSAADYQDSEWAAVPAAARSALAVPVMFGDRAVGVIHLYGDRPAIFRPRIVTFVEVLADQAAIAIGTSRRYQEQVLANQQLRVRAERMGRIFQLGELFRQGISLEEMLEEVAQGVQETVGFDLVLINLVDPSERVMRRTAQAGLPLAVFEEMQAITPPLEQAQSLMQDAYRISSSYFLPAEGTEELTANLPTYQRTQERMGTGPRAWDPLDLLLVPLYGSGGQLLGMMSVDEPRSGRRPDLTTVEALEIFANQAAFSIENYRLIERIQQEAEATRRERDRLAQLHLVASEIQSAADVPARLQVVANGIHEAGWGRVVITLRDEHLEPTALLHAGYTPEAAAALENEVLPGRIWRMWINDLGFHELKLGAGYYLRYNRTWVRRFIYQSMPPDPEHVAEDRWHPEDVLYLPLVGQDQKRIIGIISMRDPADGRVPTASSLQPFELFASQAAAAIETTRLYQETVRAAEQEQHLNEIMEVVSRSLSPDAVLEGVGRGLQPLVPFTRMSVAVFDAERDHFETLIADLAPDASVSIRQGDPLAVDGTALGAVFREAHTQTFHLLRESDARREYADLDAWFGAGERSTLIVPIIARGQPMGALHLGSELENAFDYQENIDLIERLANLSGVALDNARLFQQTRQRSAALDEQASRLAFLNRISQRLAQTLDPQEIYQIVLSEMQAALGCDYGGLMLIQDDDTSRLVLSTHPQDPPVPNLTIPLKGNPVAEAVLATRQPLIAEDLLHDERFRAMWEVQRARQTAAMLIVPVIMGERVIGTIGLDSAAPRSFTPAEIELAMTAANQAAIAIEKGRLFVEAQQRATELDEQARRLTLVNRVSSQLAETLDPQAIYRIVLTELAENLNVPLAGLVLFENETVGRLVLDYPLDTTPPDLTLNLINNSSIERVRETLKPLMSSDVLHDPLFQQAWDVLRLRGSVSLMIVPLLVGDKVIGTIGLDSKEPRVFTEAEVEIAATIANQASVAIEKARLYSETLGLTIFNQAVVESIQQGIVVLDRNLRVLRVNSFMTQRYGWTDEAIGQLLFEYRPEYEEYLRESVMVALAMGQPQEQFDIKHRDSAGALSIRNYYVYPMLEGRKVTGIVLLVEDVTERALLEEDLNTRAVQMAALSEVSSQITSTLDPNQVINLVLDALARVIPYDGVSLWLRDSERDELRIVAARGYQDADSPDAEELIGLKVEIPYSPLFREMSEKARVINAPDVSEDDTRFPYGSAAIYKNWLGAPLISKGNVVGLLALEKREPYFYNPLHEQLTLTFANQAAVALDNAQLFQETRARATALNEQAERLALLNRVSMALAQSLDLENIYEIALHEAAVALNLSEGAAIELNHEEGVGRVVVEYPRGNAPPELLFELAGNDLLERVQRSLVPLAIENVPDDPLAAPLRPLLRQSNVESTLLVPLVVGGAVNGILRLDALDNPCAFSAEQIELAQTIASQAAIAVQNASLFEQTAVRTRELETLFESAQATAVTLDLNEVVRRVTIQMLSALRADACTVFLWDEVNDRLEVRGEISAQPPDVPADPLGTFYPLTDFPLRARAVHDRELMVARLGASDLPPGEAAILARHHAAARMLIPLVVNDISIGLVEVETLDPERQFKAEEVRLARTLASQAAISIENARLQTETRRTVEELYVINDMAAALSSARSVSELLGVVAEQLPNLTDAQGIYVALYDSAAEKLHFPLAVLNDEPQELPVRPLGADEFSHILRRKAPLLLAGEAVDEARRNMEIAPLMPEARSFLGVPLFAGDELIGVLAICHETNASAFQQNDQRVLTTVGSQLGVAIQGVRLLQQTLQLAEELDQRVRDRTAELEQERQHISTLYGITTELALSLEMDRLLHRALDMVAQAVGATQGAILAFDPNSKELVFRAHLGWPIRPSTGEPAQKLQLNQGLAGWAVAQRQNVIVDNVQQDPRWLRLGPADDIPQSAMVALIETGGDVLGVIMLYSERLHAFTPDHLRLVTAAANQVANAMNNAVLYSIVSQQAERLHDMLMQEQVEATKSGAILDSVADGVVVADAEGHVIVFNEMAEQILGVPAGEVLQAPLSDIAGLYGKGASRWINMVEQLAHQPARYRAGAFLEERMTLENNHVISVRLSPVQMNDQLLGTVSIIRDITREVEVDRLKSEFVATVSHELRTPMTSIKGYADLLLLGAAGEVSEQQQRFLETIKQNADRLSELVNDLLDISRIDQGRIELRFAPVSVELLIEGLADRLRGRAEDEKRPMEINVHLPDDRALTIWGDHEKVAQIFNNLGDNAFNYTPPGGRIDLSALHEDKTGHVMVMVADTGIGIPPEIGDRIFERFFRGDESHELVMDTPGTGLGLSIVREYVQMHHGKIWFSSEVGKGTTFYVELPSRAPEASDSSAA